MKKILVNYTILATIEVDEDADEQEMMDAVEAYAENEGFRYLVDDCEASVIDENGNNIQGLVPDFHFYNR